MNLFTEWKGWAKTPPGIACTVICAICATLLCFQAWWTFAAPVPPSYHADFSGARWIRASPTAATGYFRKKFFVTDPVDQAWISIAATDYYELSINGTSLILPQSSLKIYPQMTGSFISGDQETQFDLTPYILPGENVITVYVRRRMLDRETNLLVKGLVSEGTHKQWIFSDDSWKAKTVPDDMVGLGTWTKPYVMDDSWPNAQLVDRAVPGILAQAMDISPAVFEKPVKGSWIGTHDPSEHESYFRRDFTPDWRTKETWLELCTSGDFEVYLNDRLVTNAELLAQVHGSTQSAPQLMVNVPPVNNAELINLGPWMRGGKNRLEIRAENSQGENALQAEIVSLRNDGSVRAISSDSTWLARGAVGSAWTPARELAPYGSPMYGQINKLSYPSPTATQEIGRETFNGVLLSIVILLVWFAVWLFFSSRLASRLNVSYGRALILDALAQMPIILVLALLWLASCDIRLRAELPYQPIFFWLVLAFSVLLRFGLWFSHLRPRPFASTKPDRFTSTRHFIRTYGFGLALTAIVVLAFVIRVSGLMNFSLDQDEIFIRNVDHGVIERGFPSIEFHGLLYRLTTYELVPWPQVVCAILTGFPDWSLRVPSLIYGTLMAGLLGLFGSRMFDRRTGLLAAVIYALLSWNIHWSRHCFHLQQAQFSAMLCFYTFYLAIKNGGGVDRRYFPLACILFCTTYLTWEGSGFILPAFAVAIVALYPTDWSWLRQYHFWTCFTFVAALVLIQLCDREITLPPYLGLGSGLSDISSPSLNFLNPTSDLTFYLSHIFFSEAHVLLVILLFLGLPLCWHSKPTRYVLVMYFTLLACYSGLLPIYSVRYAYFYQSLVVLGGCAVAIQFYDRIVALARSVEWAWIGNWARASAAVFILLIFLAGTETGLKIHRITYNVQNPDFFSRQQDGYIEYKVPSDYIAARFKPGDTVVGVLPHTFMHFTGIYSYALNSLLLKRMYYLRDENPPHYADRYSGTMSFRDMPELMDAFYTHKRVWIVAAPLLALAEGSDQPTRVFLQGISRMVYEDSFSRIYLWDGGGDPTAIPSNQPNILPSSAGAVLNPKLYPSTMPAHNSSTTGATTTAQSTDTSNEAPVTTPQPSSPPASTATSGGSGGSTGSGGGAASASAGSGSMASSSGGANVSVSPTVSSGKTGSTLSSGIPFLSSSSLSRATSGNLNVSSSASRLPGTSTVGVTPTRAAVPGQYTPAGGSSSHLAGGGGGSSGGAPATTSNPAGSSSIGINSSSYSTTSISVSGGRSNPQEVIGPNTTPSAYRNIIPNP